MLSSTLDVSSTYSTSNIVIKTALKNFKGFLKGCHLNIQSIVPNINELQISILNTNMDFISVSETWLRSEMNEYAVEIEGYNLFRKDRNNAKAGYGGVCLYVRKEIKCKIINISQSIVKKLKSDLEFLFLELRLSNRKILIMSFYNPPPSKKRSYNKFKCSLNDFELILNYFSIIYNDIFITGDMNIDLLDSNSPITKKYIELIKYFGMSIVNNTEPTHFANNSCATLIDHFIVSNLNSVKFYNHVSFGGATHHDFIFFAIDLVAPISDQYFYYRDFNCIDRDDLVENIETLSLNSIYYSATSTEQIEIFNSNVNYLFDRCVPLKKN